jgi:hypothetical protein
MSILDRLPLSRKLPLFAEPFVATRAIVRSEDVVADGPPPLMLVPRKTAAAWVEASG